MRTFHLVRNKYGEVTYKWELIKEKTDNKPIGVSISTDTKAAALTRAIIFCRQYGATVGPCSLKIHKKNGYVEEERTYPRKADPKQSKG